MGESFRKIEQIQQIRIGVDYYPEHWPREMWEKDADRMKECGVTIVRMAEFAWCRLEPEEGIFEFSWLDEIVSIFSNRDIDVFLCTPTCTPPLWLFEKYPEVIQVGADGHTIPIGIRGHRCMNHPVYREKCEKIIREMVTHYREQKAVIGYQIDNELEANHCRCSVCEEKFRNWMKKKYGTVEAINRAYGNVVWSGEYSAFSQVKPPMGEHIKWQNPSLTLDFNRYASESTIEYLEFQRTLIHSIDPDALITTNNWLCENMPDFYKMFENLDFVSYDNYPATQLPKDNETLYSHAFHLDLMRGIKRQNFWIMEQLSGMIGSWTPMSHTSQKGMLKGYALQAIAHGADAVIHFRWRTGTSGAEMYWHGILDHSNVPGRRYQEFSDLGKTVKELDELKGTKIKNQIALLYGSDQEYAFKLQHQAEGMYYMEQLKSFHDAFTAIGLGVDIINEFAELSGYRIVVAPTMMITHKETVEHLYQFAKSGGTVVLTNRSGVKDEYNKCIMEQLPTVYTNLIGARVTEYDAVGGEKIPLDITDKMLTKYYQEMQTTESIATQWCDLLEVDTAKVLATYHQSGSVADGMAAITVNDYGKGRAYYLGTVTNRGVYIALAKQIAAEKDMEFLSELPLGIEVTYRENDEHKWCFVFNNTEKCQKIKTPIEKELQPFEMYIHKM